MSLFDWLKPRPTPPATPPPAPVRPSAPRMQAPPPPPEPDPMPPEPPAQILAMAKPCWFPEAADGAGDDDASRFAGTPWLQEGEAHPCCGECGGKMALFLQLNSSDLPPAAAQPFGEGMLQLFYCMACDSAYEAFSKASLVRIIHPFEGGGCSAESAGTEVGEGKRLMGWSKGEDLPGFEDAEALGYKNELSDDILDMDDAWPNEGTLGGDKLLGWPHWVQGMEYPTCPDCKAKMKYVFQVDSEINVPHMFGDCGIGHICQCPEHPQRLSFHWACS